MLRWTNEIAPIQPSRAEVIACVVVIACAFLAVAAFAAGNPHASHHAVTASNIASTNQSVATSSTNPSVLGASTTPPGSAHSITSSPAGENSGQSKNSANSSSQAATKINPSLTTGALIFSETSVSVKLGQGAPNLTIRAANGDEIGGRYPTITDSLNPGAFVDEQSSNTSVYGSSELFLVGSGQPDTRLGTHLITITAKGIHGVYTGSMTIDVLPPLAYSVSISRQWEDPAFNDMELVVTGDPGYDLNGLEGNAMQIVDPPPGFDCSYNPQYTYDTMLTSGQLLIHWRCQNVAARPVGYYTVTFRFEDEFGTVRVVPVTFDYTDTTTPGYGP